MAKGVLRRRLGRINQSLADQPVHSHVGRVKIPEDVQSPWARIAKRIVLALGVLCAVVLIVYIDRDGYTDNQKDGLTLLDCFYYATVSLSTTGYGDITPVTQTARFVNIVVITPLRVAFLIVLIGTTVETLTTESRQLFKIQQWRNKVRNHTVVIGYGTKGRSAVAAMVGDEVAPADIVVVDENAGAIEKAERAGLVTVRGNATDSDVLRLASVQHAKSIIIAGDEDATNVLVTLTARELAPKAKIIAAVREAENQHLLEQSGADSTVVTAETAGRLLGIAVQTPSVVEIMEDLLTPDAGFAIAERAVTPKEAGSSPRHQSDIVLGVVRDGELIRVDDPAVDSLELGDRLLYIRSSASER